jgi:hypothetical protein
MMTISSELRDHPIFICGHPKSGTSLLRAILDSHPQLVVYPEETVFFRRFLPQAENLDLESQLALAERLLIHIFRWNQASPTQDQEGFPDRDYSGVSYEAVQQKMEQLVRQNYRHPGDILSAAVMAYGEVSAQAGPDTRWWVEKSPYNEYYASRIFDWWPEARCIHILRDPRDNYASYRRKHTDWTPEFFAANWSRSTQAGLDNQRDFGSQRYLILRYEDLTGDPQVKLNELQAYLKIDWDTTLVSPTRAGEQWSGNSMFADQFKEISSQPVARWVNNLSPLDAAIIELKAAEMMKTYGYTPEALPGAGLSQALEARWRLVTWPVRRKLSRQISKD